LSFWHDPQSNILLYDVPDAVRMLPHLDGAQTLHNGYMAVPVTLRNCQVLRHFELPVIPLMDRDYDWPLRGRHADGTPFRPRAHQRHMTNFMVTHPHSFNLGDMGTMKTLATLWACDYVMQLHPGMRAVIVCPKSIRQRVWGDALTQHFLGRRTYTIVDGSHARRREHMEANSDFYLMGHDAIKQGSKLDKRHSVVLSGFSADIMRKDIGIAVIDEASGFRDGSSMRSRVARAGIATKPYFWLLTGTPTPNGPLDAHGLARLVNNASGESYDRYKKRIMYQMGPWKWVPRPGATAEAHKLLQPSVRFEMRECTDVPPSTEQMRDVKLSEEQQKHMRDLKRDLQLQIAKGSIVVAPNEAALRLKLIQISCGAIYDTNHKATRIDCAPRLAELRAVIEEARRKVIIFAPLTSVVQLLYDELTEYSRAKMNGEVPTKVRDEIIKRFVQDADPQIIICDPGIVAEGFNLSVATTVCWYGATDKTLLYLQGNARIVRPGQDLPTTIVQLASTATEREIFKRAASNTSMQGAILQLVRDQ
jgi:hypothetical protein